MEKRLMNFKRLRVLLLFATLLLLSFSVKAQSITGKVTEENGVGLVGVNIIEKGTNNGAITDMNGDYSLTVQSENAILVFSSIGYQTTEISVNGQTLINLALPLSEEAIDEVVVVGYGTMKKSDVSGASVTVSADKVKNSATANIDQALQGRAAGVTTVVTSGQPGASVSINIRGNSTLMQDAQPLYVVDGVPIQNVSRSGQDVGIGDLLGNGNSSTFSGLSSINPDDILSYEILKDASATAIYGSRAANGVILITTKSGQKGATTFSYNGSYGMQEQVKKIDVMNLREFAQFSNDYAAETDGRDSRVNFLDPSLLGEGTDWQAAVFQRAPIQNHQISANGGTEKLNFYVSGSFFDQKGTVVGSNFDRFTTMVKLSADLKSWFKMGTNLSLARYNDKLGLTNSQDGIISTALLFTPDVPIYNTDGTFAGEEREGSSGRVNPIGKAIDEEIKLKRTNLRASYWTEINFIPELKLRTEIATDLMYTNAYTFEPTYQYGQLTNTTNTAARQYSQNAYWEVKNYLTYSKTFGEHNITGMFGQETSQWSWETVRGVSSQLTSNEVHEPGLGDPTTFEVGSSSGSGARVSFFGRFYYGYGSKYNATYTYRRDGSSNFGDENRWAPFHAFSLSWRVINEDFMQFAQSTFSNIKLRAGWGQVGNDNIDAYQWGAGIGAMPTGLGNGFKQTNIANPYVHWEKQESWNFGLDLGILKDRISLTAEYYIKTSKDMLMDMQLPSYMGTSGNASSRLNPPTGNFGEIENKGFEISVNAQPIKGEFSWETNFQISANRNRLISLQGTESSALEGRGQWFDVVALSEIGESLYNFYGYKVAGIYQNKEDLLNSPKPSEYPSDGNFVRNGLWVGDIKYQDLSGPNGTPDGVINDFDKTFIGSPLPKFTYGFNNTFSYKNFELSVFITGSYGNKVLNYVGRDLTAMTSMWNNQLSSVADRTMLEAIDPTKIYPYTNSYGSAINNWYNDIDNVRVANPGQELPRAIGDDPADNQRMSDRYIEDGSYLRFKSINLAYNIPQQLLTKVKLKSARVYVNLLNMWTITNYTGFDPEIGASQTSDYVMGLDNGRYPAPRTYTFGINITF